ncbi:lytic transglycosylase [Salinimicrobium marinum]|uniref:Lytic transglycosylase n=1 Tax=Salinimicrobium marinum TaxID=680283 RepID=A0A918VXJ4_9FLAO|nr:lytic transglycosylase domain-containing protein [Salinimicrobium marinum]GHA38927.1 lytic transglycosylase [Salinimicrobium marinum]
MMEKILPFLFLLFSVSAFSQHEKIGQEEKSGQAAIDSVSMDSLISIHKNLFSLKNSKDVDFANKVSFAVLRDSVVANLADDPDAALMDSIWQKELFTSSLYHDFHNDIIDQDYNEDVFKDLPTDTLKMRLERLNAKTPFSIEYNPLLENVIHSYLKRHKQSYETLMALSGYYFPMFEQQLDRYNIPLEIKYLAIVESTLNPRARSRMGATGLWQFMYATGKMHGLDVTSYVDDRMDPVKSTEAAAEYISTLYRVFGDWDLVLASYNSGPGNVSKAIRRSGGSKDYWKLRPFLPRETAGYVPAFLATLYIFEYAEEHGFQPPKPITTYFETDTIQTKRMLSFEQISEVTGVEKELLQFLNPSYKLDVIPHVPEEAYTLRLPRSKAGLFVNNEETIYEYAKAQLAEAEEEEGESLEETRITYRVKRGDYLGKIAERHGVRVSSLKEWNSLRGNNLRIGQRLVIYTSGVVASGTNTETRTGKNPRLYTVRQGDSLWSISKKFPGVTVQKLKSLNNMSGNNLKPGMKIKLSEG